MSYYILLNTDDIVYGSSHDATWDLGSLDTSNFEEYQLALHSCEFSNVIYPLNPDRRNYIVYYQEDNDPNTTIQAPFTIKNYDGTTLATELATNLSFNSPNGYTYVVAFDAETKKLTIQEGAGDPFRIVDGPYSAHREIGMDLSVTAFQTTAFTLSDPIDVSGSKYVDLLSNVTSSNISSSTNSNILYRIPLNVPFGSILFFQNSSDLFLNMNTENIDAFSISLRDDRGLPVTLPSNVSISYVFKLKRLAQ